MRPFAWGPEQEEIVAQLRSYAEHNPLSQERMQRLMARLDPPPGDDPSYRCILPVDYSCVFTVEWQPIGFVRHLSVSTPDSGRVPNNVMLQMIMPAFGFRSKDIFGMMRKRLAWLEDLGGGHKAVNMIETIKSEKHF